MITRWALIFMIALCFFFFFFFKSRNKRSGTQAGPTRAPIRVYTKIATKRRRGTLIKLERLLPFLQYLVSDRAPCTVSGRRRRCRPLSSSPARCTTSLPRSTDTGVCENNDHRHKEPYIAICVPTRKMRYEMYVTICSSLKRRSFFRRHR